MTDVILTSNERAADVPREVLLGKTLRQRAHQLRIEACSAWSDVAEKPITGLDAAKSDYARAIEERLRAIIDELADLSSAIETKPNALETREGRMEGLVYDCIEKRLGLTYDPFSSRPRYLFIVDAIDLLMQQARPPAQKDFSCVYCEAGMQKVKEDLHYDVATNSSHRCTSQKGGEQQ